MSRLQCKFYDQYSSDHILSQGHPMIVSVPCDMPKESIKDTFFEINKFPKKKPTNFCKFYDSEGTFQFLLQSNQSKYSDWITVIGRFCLLIIFINKKNRYN